MRASIYDSFEAKPFVEAATQLDIGLLELYCLNGFSCDCTKSIGCDRLFKEIEGTELHGFDGFGHGCVASYHHHLAVGHQLASKRQDLHPVKFIHHQVCDNNVIGILLEHPFALGTAGRHGASVASSLQAFGHCPCVSRIVIDNEE